MNYHTDDKGRRRWRKEPAKCPRGLNDGPPLKCGGATYKGERLSDPHMAEFDEFGHNKQFCERGWSRCRQGQCRDCMRLYSAARCASNQSKFADMSDDEIMANVREKTCPQCKQVLDGFGFGVSRTTTDGLQGYCRTCRSKASYVTMSAETKQRYRAKYRANKKLRPHRDLSREQIWLDGNKTCHLCREPVSLEEMEVDHLVPYESDFQFAWLFGHVEANVAPAHRSCNASKNNRIISWDTIMANLKRDGSESALWVLENVVTKLRDLDLSNAN